VRDKIQDAVTIAKELGDDNIPVTMVGLGAYTSIATSNGLTLNDHEVAITTGNAYTAALTLEGITRAARRSGVDLAKAKVAVVGAGGNIGQILSVNLAIACASLVLLGSNRDDSLLRLQATREACLEYLRKTNTTTAPDISCETDAAILALCDVVILATSSPNRELVKPEQLKPGAIVCCTSLPTNLSTDFQHQPKGIVAFDGGLARLPENSRLNFVGMPTEGLAYGCLAETLLLGFEGHNHSFCKGKVTFDQVQRTREMAERHGFSLGALRLGGHPVWEGATDLT
jgi:predicted amino acid dehydrogenase